MLNRVLVRWITGLSVLVLGVVPLIAGPDEIAIEEQLATRIQRSLDSIYGPNNFIVKVGVTLTTPRYEVRYTQQSRAAVSAESKQGAKVNILPGYPVIRNLAPDNMKQLPFDSVTNYVRPSLQSTSVTLIVNRSFPKSQVGRAQSIVKDLLDLKDGRDKISVTYRPFIEQTPPVQTIEIANQSDKMGSFQNIFYLVFAVIALVFMIIYVLISARTNKTLKSLQLSGAGAGSGGGSNSAPSVSVNPSFELPKGAGGGGEIRISNAPPVKAYFDFVSETTIDKLIYLLKKENVGVDNISLIVGFLRPDLAAQLLANFDPKTQAAIAMSIVDQKMVNRVMLDKLESQIKGAIECLTGGDAAFKSIFAHLPSDHKKQVLGILEKSSPESFRRVRGNIVLFDDLAVLTDDEVKLLLADIRSEVVAVALAAADPNLYDRFDRNLTRNAKELITQFLEIKGSTIGRDEIERARQSILDVALRLERDGKVAISSRLKK